MRDKDFEKRIDDLEDSGDAIGIAKERAKLYSMKYDLDRKIMKVEMPLKDIMARDAFQRQRVTAYWAKLEREQAFQTFTRQ